MERIEYDLPSHAAFATIYHKGRIVGTLHRPRAVFRSGDGAFWVVADNNGVTVLRRNLRPLRSAITRALGLS